MLVGGCGVPLYQWDDVVAGLDGQAIVRLDRPGLTDTPWPGVLPTLAAEVATLDDLLRTIDGPVVVVAHSMAGPHARGLRPGAPRTAGRARSWSTAASIRALGRSVRSRPGWPSPGSSTRSASCRPCACWVRLADRALVAGQSRRRLRDPAHPMARAVYRNRDAMASVVAEQAAYRQQLWDLHMIRSARAWPSLPTVVLTAAGTGDASWIDLQRRLADSLGAEHVVLPGARHMIMLDEPAAVVAAIRTLL